MKQYVIFLNDETWIIIDADDYIYETILHTIDFYRNGDFVGSFDTLKIIGFCKYESALLRILKNQKVCNGFEWGDDDGK